MRFEVALFELADDPASAGPRLLGRLTDPELIDLVRDRLASARRRELAQIEAPVRLVRPDDGDAA
jgi:hypothetical protein